MALNHSASETQIASLLHENQTLRDTVQRHIYEAAQLTVQLDCALKKIAKLEAFEALRSGPPIVESSTVNHDDDKSPNNAE
jgi:hypothetical protein